MPGAVLGVSLVLFAVSAVLEGVITVAVIAALEAMNPNFVRRAASGRSHVLGAVACGTVLLAVVGVLFASTRPDGIQALLHTPLAPYQAGFAASVWLHKAAAGLMGVALILGACLLFGRLAARHRSA
jgi:hypothetical protein